MTIVILGDRYYLPFADGFKEIPKSQALYLYEQGYITQENVLDMEVD